MNETRNCQSCKQNFTIEPDDSSFYEKMKVPPPTWCPECRAIRRLLFRNEHTLFRKPDAVTGKDVFSAYPKDSPIKIYDHDYWWSDAWDPADYARDYDFSINFFKQFRTLMLDVPWCSRSITDAVNSDYSNNANGIKNCYMTFSGGPGENLFYCVGVNNLKDSTDCFFTKDSSLCYETFSVVDSYMAFWSTECATVNNVWFSLNCRNCTDCFGCVNLHNKKYCIFNEQYTKEEYNQKIKEFNIGSYASMVAMKERITDFWKKHPMKYMHTMMSPNSSGDYIYGSKNAKQSFHIYKSEDVKYSQQHYKAKDSYDYSLFGWGSELMYECTTCGISSSNLRFCFECWPGCNNLEYCMECHSSSNCFGCVGLKKKEYCIFNRQYSKEEYYALREKIVAQMNEFPYTDDKGRVYKYGEFFPIEFSPFAYNQSLAFDYYPKSKEQIQKEGYVWVDQPKRDYAIDIQPNALPDHINDATDALVSKTIGCQHSAPSGGGACEHNCTTAFKIMPEELQFYKRFGIPLPRLCVNCRYGERLKQLNPIKFYDRTCAKCSTPIQTAYSPDRPEIVYCESCYQQEVM